MKKILILFLFIVFSGCDSEEVPACFKASGEIVTEVIDVASFEEIIVFEGVKLYVQQGQVQEVKVETGENLLEKVKVSVENNRLSIKNGNSCNLFRDYGVTRVFVTLPNLTWLQNSSGMAIESIGTLKLEKLWLRSVNQERDASIHTIGDFILDLEVKDLRITNDNFSNYFLSGSAENFNVFFAAGDGRLQAGDLVVNHYNIFHRGTNKMIIYPRLSLQGEIRSSGDVILVNRPPEVRVEEFYTGRLIYRTPYVLKYPIIEIFEIYCSTFGD